MMQACGGGAMTAGLDPCHGSPTMCAAIDRTPYRDGIFQSLDASTGRMRISNSFIAQLSDVSLPPPTQSLGARPSFHQVGHA